MPFAKGQSGNPGGRSKAEDEIKRLARMHAPQAIKRLSYWLSSDNAKASVSAAQALLDRGYGKPAQQVGVGLSDDALRDLVITWAGK